MEVSDIVRRLSDQLRLCVNRQDTKNVQLITKAIENILTVDSSSNSSTKTREGDAIPPLIPLVNLHEYGQQEGAQSSVSPSTCSLTSSTSATSEPFEDKKSILKFLRTAVDPKKGQVELLLWHRGTNCCLNTMTPLQLSTSLLDSNNDGDGSDEILIQVQELKNPILILSVELTPEGTVSADTLRNVFATARRSAGSRTMCLQVHKWGNSWGSLWPNGKQFADCCEAQGVKLTVVKSKPATALDIPVPAVSGRIWAGHHAMAAFVTAHLSLIYPTWVIHREFDQWPDALLSKAKVIFQTYWPGGGYYSDSFVMSWFKDEFVGWSQLLANPTSISRLSSSNVFIEPEVEMRFRVNSALLHNGTVRLVFAFH